MTTTQSNVSAARPLRLWPGIIVVAAVWAARLAAPVVVPGPIEELMVRGFSSLGGRLAIAIWWLLFSREPAGTLGHRAGKTWNHPVVVGDLLLVRNGEEMAAFRLPAAER